MIISRLIGTLFDSAHETYHNICLHSNKDKKSKLKHKMNVGSQETSVGVCPICGDEFPMTNLCVHASSCNGKTQPVEKNQAVFPSNHNWGGMKRKNIDSSPSSFFKKFKNVKDNKPSQDQPVSKGSPDQKPNNSTKLIEKKKSMVFAPLSDRMRPTDFSSYSGQQKTLGPNSFLQSCLVNISKLPSLIIWGPPGCGKTSLANIIAHKSKGFAKFVKMSAVTCGVADVKDVIQTAKTEQSMFKRRTILFLDEVHRFNKTQQDHFLPHIESGTIIFIGATTENPGVSLNNALLSRCKLITLEKLDREAVVEILERALNTEDVPIVEAEDAKEAEGLVRIEKKAVDFIAQIVDGDARAALNNLELVLTSAKVKQRTVTVDMVGEVVEKAKVRYDKTGEQHYLLASALQKSIRGGDDNAALYYLGRMLKGGEDPAFIGRRLVRCASEDIGLADHTALPLAVSAMQGAQLLGRPECDLLLAQATVHLARANKSHELLNALSRVYNIIDDPGPNGLPDVPIQLKMGGGKVGAQLGWGKGYSHDLDKVKHIQYMPKGLENTKFF